MTNKTHHDPKATPRAAGRRLDDTEIDALAQEAERGYDPERLVRKVGRKPMGATAARVVPVRLDPDLDAALQATAREQQTSVSAVIRRAVRAWIGQTHSPEAVAPESTRPATFEVYQVSGSRWRFRLRSSADEVIATSESFPTKSAALAAIGSVHQAVTSTPPTER